MAKLTNEQVIESLKEMTILEVNELVKAIEEAFGVTAAAPVAAAAAAAARAAPDFSDARPRASADSPPRRQAPARRPG